MEKENESFILKRKAKVSLEDIPFLRGSPACQSSGHWNTPWASGVRTECTPCSLFYHQCSAQNRHTWGMLD